MTSQADEIQRLIADIDNLLDSNFKRLSKLLPSHATEPREVLERIRDFLGRFNESEPLAKDAQSQPSEHKPLSPLLAKFVEQTHPQPVSQNQQPDAAQITAALSQKLSSEVSALIEPLKAELAGLLQERAALVQEIRQLEQKRLQNYSLSQQLANQEQIIHEFLQVLGNRLLPTLSSQLAESLANLPIAANSKPTDQSLVETSDPQEHLTKLGGNLDQRLASLDGTVNVVFEALQRNIQTYQESLAQALARMHSQGMQGEQVMASFVNNLTQYLQQFPADQASSSTNQQDIHSAATQPELGTGRSPISQAKAEDFHTVVSQLLADAPPSSGQNPPPIPTTFNLDSPQLDEVDEVDELYASLFSTENVTNQVQEIPAPQVEFNELSTQQTTTESELNITDSQPVQVVDSPGETVASVTQQNLELIPDPPAPQTESSPEWNDLFFEEVTQTTSSPAADSPAADSIYRITALTDLLVDLGAQQQVLPTAEPAQEVTTNTPEAKTVIANQQQEQSLDNYIPASSQENLLQPEATATMPDITLDDEQLQLLDQDLAQFDGLLNTQSPLIASWVSSNNKSHEEQLHTEPDRAELTENNPTVADSIELPQLDAGAVPQAEHELDFSPIIEKKKESTTGSLASSSVSTAHNFKHPAVSTDNILESRWYLGIDLGTTGISAALLNSSTFVVYPIYWSAENQAGASSFGQSLRLPAEVYLPTASVHQGETESTETHKQTAPASVSPENLASKSDSEVKNTPYSAQLKPYLQVAIPYKNARQKWEPVLQFNEFSAGPLIWVVRSLSKLLLTLKSDRQSTTQGLIAAAVGLDEQSFRTIINNIAGAICTCPSSWSEQYRFNVREALLTSKLIQHPQQVFFIEEAIASLLSVLNAGNGQTVQLSTNQGLRPIQINEQPLVGNTLALSIGATTTEMALVDLSENFSQLTHNDFMLHNFAYGGKGIEQDIICQLLLPPKSRQSRSEIGSGQISSQPGLWRSNIPGLEQMYWQSLGLEELELPRVGEPDIIARVRLQQRLESSLLGQAVLDAALALKLILQHQETFTLDLADQRWVLERRDLESQVLVPFVRRLNRELNKLLVARGIPTEAINQAILTGGVASITTINRWLKQKLPNAKIIQDSYLGENGAPNCSRVAYGLAMLPLHPQVLEIPKQQYTDYFLFTELLRLLPERPLSFSEVLQLFEGRGVNTRTCQQRLLAFLEGELPAGLIPNSPDSTWLTQSSQDNPDYQAIAATPLFEKQGNLTYRPNSQQLLLLRRYLDAIKASTRQSLEEPYTLSFSLEFAH
ncbi:hypothetical protein NIES2100_00370 [Calothrix sp. NIES-2100]|uniref:DUF2397 family protein n=1 Tax=Calothrix sp. NIES-2100 TaxID=1954172 RepID=UPI000B612147|nr:hypothetical protein NIES2100_00370 [Calothrix sp. NIES-2100]